MDAEEINSQEENKFLRTYKDFIYYFNLLDRNLGYCLRYCMSRRADQRPEKWLSVNFDSKVKKIIALAKENGLQETFSEWHVLVQECRHLRNIVSHGRWEWRRRQPRPISYSCPEVEAGEGFFTTEEFQAQFLRLRHAFETFDKIRTPLELAIVESVKRSRARDGRSAGVPLRPATQGAENHNGRNWESIHRNPAIRN